MISILILTSNITAMSIPILGRRRLFSTLSSFDFDEYSIHQEIHRQQYEQTRKAFKSFKENHLVTGQSVDFGNLERILIERDNSYVIEHLETSMSDHLKVCIDGTEIELDKPLFPKRKNPYISINIPSIAIREQIESKYTPDSIVDFLIAVKDWIPEYLSIEENAMIQEKQRQMACTMAFDLIKRTIEPILDGKNFQHTLIGPEYNNKASLRIAVSDAFVITLEVNLLEDFLDQVVKYVESLPINSAQ